MKNVPLLLGTIFGTILLIVGVAIFFSKSSPVAQPSATPVDQSILLEDASKVKGKTEAAITVVEFSDFQCPACKGYQPMIQQLESQYPDTLKVVYKHYPLDQIHPNARFAAQASEVALEMGKFWEFHDKLFATQDDWSKIADKKELFTKFASYAEELKIDKAKFLEKIESDSIAQKVQKDKEVGDKVDVQATPTFFINGVKTAAPQLLETVESLQAQQKK